MKGRRNETASARPSLALLPRLIALRSEDGVLATGPLRYGGGGGGGGASVKLETPTVAAKVRYLVDTGPIRLDGDTVVPVER